MEILQNLLSVFLTINLMSCNGRVNEKSVKDDHDDSIIVKDDGDIIIGGLFPMHEIGKRGEDCGDIKRERGIQRLEAMFFAIDRINNDTTLLPGIELGVHILDTCTSDTYALTQSVEFIKPHISTLTLDDKCKSGRKAKLKPVKGVIGAASSTVSIMVASILGLFKVDLFSLSC